MMGNLICILNVPLPQHNSFIMTCFKHIFLGAPKAYVDPFMKDITAKAGEPFKIRIPYKGSPAPDTQWFNVSFINTLFVNLTTYSKNLFNLFHTCRYDYK